jgi:hypothetical protein
LTGYIREICELRTAVGPYISALSILFYTHSFKDIPLAGILFSNNKNSYVLRTTKGFAYCFLLGLLFDPDDGGNMFLLNVGEPLPDYTTLYPRSHHPSRKLFFMN